MRGAIFLFSLLVSCPLWAETKITHDVILDLLGKEKRSIQAKDVTSLSSLFTEDAVLINNKKEKLSKSQYIADTFRAFMDTEAILIKPEIIHETISEDGMSAEIEVKSVEKYLLVRGDQKKVSTSVNTWRATIVFEDGLAKYKFSEMLASE